MFLAQKINGKNDVCSRMSLEEVYRGGYRIRTREERVKLFRQEGIVQEQRVKCKARQSGVQRHGSVVPAIQTRQPERAEFPRVSLGLPSDEQPHHTTPEVSSVQVRSKLAFKQDHDRAGTVVGVDEGDCSRHSPRVVQQDGLWHVKGENGL